MSDIQNLRYIDVAVTYTADQFQGIYRGKKYHEPDFSAVLDRARSYNCEKVILTTMTLQGAYENLKITRQFPDMCTMTLGVHPYHVQDLYQSPPDDNTEGQAQGQETPLDHLRRLCLELQAESPSPLVAFGEIGLDYDYLDRADKETQHRAFRDQLSLAVEMELDLPLFLHARAACADFIEILREYLPRLPRGGRGLVHSFVGTKEEMQSLLDLGLEISVNGASFRTAESREMVRHIPLEKLQLETDAPWCEILEKEEPVATFLKGARELPGARKHGKFVLGQMVKNRNESCTMERVAMVVAGLKGVAVQEVAEAAWRNSVRMFGLSGV